MEKLPVVGNVAKILPKFDNSNNPAIEYFGSDGFYGQSLSKDKGS